MDKLTKTDWIYFVGSILLLVILMGLSIRSFAEFNSSVIEYVDVTNNK